MRPSPECLCLALFLAVAVGGGEALPPCRATTAGPKFHWFGYYDKLQFDPTSRYVLGMEVDFEGRSPRADGRLVCIDSTHEGKGRQLYLIDISALVHPK